MQSGERVLVVSPANDERRELNKAIRKELISDGLVAAAGQQHTILVNRGLSGVQRAIAYNYEEGDVIRFTRGSKQFAIAKDGYARVEDVDREANLLAVTTPDGRRIEYNPTGSSASKSSARSSAPSHEESASSSGLPTGRSASPTASSLQLNPSMPNVR